MTQESPRIVHVTVLSVSAHSSVFPDFLQVLSNEERDRAARYRLEKDRRSFVLGRVFLRRLCGQKLGIDPRVVAFQIGAYGKPRLAKKVPSFEFNISHSGDRVLVAWTEGGPIGVDIEQIQENSRAEEVANIAFSREEKEGLRESERRLQSGMFYGIWTRKEAVVKAEGCGIGVPLSEFSVWGAAGWKEHVNFPGSGRFWQVHQLDLDSEYAAALAVSLGSVIRVVDSLGDGSIST